MRSLLLGFILLAKLGWGVCAPGSMSFLPFQGSLIDSCGNYLWTNTGTLTYDGTNDCPSGPGPQMITSFGVGENVVGSSAFRTAFEATATNCTIEFFLYLTAAPTLDVVTRWDDGPVSYAWEISFSSDGADPATLVFRRFSGSWVALTSSQTLAVGQCYNIAVTVNGTTGKIYTDNIQTATGTLNTPVVGITRFLIGGEAADLSGQISGYRVSNVVKTQFPTIDPSSDDDPCMYQGAGCAE